MTKPPTPPVVTSASSGNPSNDPPLAPSTIANQSSSLATHPPANMTPEEFSLETRFVILNFMGLVPGAHLEEDLSVGSSPMWQSSLCSSGSSSDNRRSFHYSRSSSNSSHEKQEQPLSELTDERLPTMVGQGAMSDVSQVKSDVPRVLAKKPLRKSSSLSREEGGPHSTLRQDTINSSLSKLCKSSLMRQLRKTKSATTSRDMGGVLVEMQAREKWVGGRPSNPRRSSTVDEESEIESGPGVEAAHLEAQMGRPTEPDSGGAGEPHLGTPSGTPTDRHHQTFQRSSRLSLLSTVEDPSEPVDGSTVSIIKGRPFSCSRLESLDPPDAEGAEAGSGGGKQTTGRVFHFQDRSRSPARPMTLDLSEDAPRSPSAPHWRQLVHTPQGANGEIRDDVDSGRSGSNESESSFKGRASSQSMQLEGSESPALQLDGTSECETPDSPVEPKTDSSDVDEVNGDPEQLSSLCTGSLLSTGFLPAEDACTSLSDLDLVDVTSLVNTHALPPVIIPLKEELCEQWHQLEHDCDELGVHAEMGCLTPCGSSESVETEVAHRLSLIGDAVQAEYGVAIERAIRGVACLPRDCITYEVFLTGLQHAMGPAHVDGWNQVALVLLFTKRLLLAMLQRGDRHLRRLFDLSERALTDRAADFIRDQGGWATLQELELSSVVSSSGVPTPILTDHSDTEPSSAVASLNGLCETDSGGSVIQVLAVTTVPTPTPTSSSNDTDTTPASPATVMSASPSDKQSNKSPQSAQKVADTAATARPTQVAVSQNGAADSGRLSASSPVAVAAAADIAMGGHLTPEEITSIEDAVTSIQPEIQLIRQVSADLRNELDIGRQDNNNRRDDDAVWRQVASVALLASLGVTVLVVLRLRSGR